jgi:hypothetical protein
MEPLLLAAGVACVIMLAGSVAGMGAGMGDATIVAGMVGRIEFDVVVAWTMGGREDAGAKAAVDIGALDAGVTPDVLLVCTDAGRGLGASAIGLMAGFNRGVVTGTDAGVDIESRF